MKLQALAKVILGQRFTAGMASGSRVILFWGLLATSAWSAPIQVLPNNVPAAAARLHPVEPLSVSKHLDLVITLPLRNQDTLTRLLWQIYNPASPDYHHYLTPGQFAEQFGPTEQDYQAVIAFAESNGLAVTRTHSNRTLLDVNGPVASIQKAFHVNLRTYKHPTEDRLFYAPDTGPSLNLSVPVLAINGLDNFNLPRPMSLFTDFSNLPSNAIPFAAGSGPRGSFIGKDFRAAYAPGVSLDGSGQAVGLFELDTYYPSDIATYESVAGLPNVPLTNVLVDGFDQSPGGNNVEVALDIDMAISMAPGLSKVIVYEGYTPNDILNRMATDDSARQLSCSWGFGPGIDPVREQIFEQFAAQGQSFFQASGDLGGGSIYPPSDDPFVTVVGGTSLTTSSTNGAWESETTWPDSSGGISGNYSIPVWQQDVNMTTNQGSTTMRNVPDVACLADSVIWLVANNGDQSVVGGTSAAAPEWAGFAALVNQQAAANNQPGVGFLNPDIYAIGQSPAYTSAFHDISSGNNTNSTSVNEFFAVPGYDLCTGWGTPNGTNLISALRPAPDALQIIPQTSIAFNGTVNGPFSPATQTFYLINHGTNTLNWSLGNTSVWFSASPASGSLPAGATAPVTISTTASADTLPAGQSIATLFFANLNNGFSLNRQMVLNVANPVAITVGVVFSNLYSFTGGDDGGNPNGLIQNTNGLFYGTTQNGGTAFAGTVFQITTNGLVTSLYSFTGGNDGANPFAMLAQGPDGNFYGTAFQGGADDNGTIFRITTNGVLDTLVTFGITNGDLPFAGLTLGADTNFYGTSHQGGVYGHGTAFMMTTNGTQKLLYSFSGGSDGNEPSAGLVQGGNGSFYGTTRKGGAYGDGAIFSISTSGDFATLYSFDETNGAFPTAGLTEDSDGNFYGVAAQGGAYSSGTLFEITPAGLLTNLYSFTGGTDGGNPDGTLVQGADGNFYGTTAQGGAYGDGTVFVVSPGGTLTTLVQFNGYDGANPQAALALGSDGYFYGTTQNGGAGGNGVIFRFGITATPHITSQPANQSVFTGANVQFNVAVLGATPFLYHWQKDETNLVDGGNVSGSTNRILNLASVTTNDIGNYSVLVSNSLGSATSSLAFLMVTSSPPFIVTQPTNETVAAGSTAILTVSALGNLPLLYQWQMDHTNLANGGSVSGSATSTLTITNLTTANNGTYSVIISNTLGSVISSNVTLTVVAGTTPGTALATLHWFGSNTGDGQTPNGLMQANDGDLYGTTQSGGISGSSGYGTIFKITTNGLFTTLVPFTEASYTLGDRPLAALVEDTNGNFYGTTELGGTNLVGNIFQLTPGNTLTNLYSFTGGDDGSNPSVPLVLGTDGNLYGSTPTGGNFGHGNIFQMTPAGTFTNLYSFTGGADGNSPSGGLLPDPHGNFYGLTTYGGTHSEGNIFKMTPDDLVTNLYSFTGGTDGYWPIGALVFGDDGNLYGATKRNTIGAFQFYGTLFTSTTNGTLDTLYKLNYTDGAYPFAGLILGSDGNFYGTTYSGAYDQNGTVFRITPSGALTTLVAFDGFDDGAHPESALVQGVDGALYGTTTSGGPDGQGTIFRVSFTTAPEITSQPVNQTVVAGANVSFNVADFGASPLFYQWQKNSNNLTDGGDLSGSATRILTLTNVSVADSGSYSVIVSNSLGAVSSDSALLTVINQPVFQTITQTNGTVSLAWSTFSGQIYQLQYNPDLSSSGWINLGNSITATNSLTTFSDVIGTGTQRFYRVVLLP
jgi:uncharacterized repeat protein (TIGR03803 family)